MFSSTRRQSRRSAAPDSIIIRRPDDWHIHLRDGAMLRAVLPFTAGQFARGIMMPNLVPPVTTVAAAEAYRARILAARPAGSDFQPMMTCYLTDDTSADEIEKGHSKGAWIAAKLYPAGATTNSHYGVRDLKAIRAGAGADGADRHAGPDPRRSDRSRHRYLRPRKRVHAETRCCRCCGSIRA